MPPKGISKTKKTSSHENEENVHRVVLDQMRDRATKRVIAPFVRIVRKGQKLQEAEEGKQFNIFLQKKPSVLIKDFSAFLWERVDLLSLIHETASVLKLSTHAAGVTVYMMDFSTNEIYQSKKVGMSDRHKIRWKIQEGSTVASYVAYHKQHAMVEDIIKDDRFPDGIGYQSNHIKSVLCVPVVTPDNTCVAVIELYKLLFDPPFTTVDLKMNLIVTGWMGATIQENSHRLSLQKQLELNDYLLDLTKCFLGEGVVMEIMITEITKFAKVALNAERCTVFVLEADSGDDLVAEVFDDTYTDSKDPKKPQKVRFGKERGIAGTVARTGVLINLKDAYKDARFNKEMDQKSGSITRSILCMPIVGDKGILGVAQVINKKTGGTFNSTDEMLFKTFCTYCALALRYTEVHKKLEKKRYLNNCYLKIIGLQVKPCIHDLEFYTNKNEVLIPADFEEFSWYIRDEEHQTMPMLCLYIFHQLIKSTDFDSEATIRYILSVRKFYRNNPFHNFEHAFNVTHCIYLLLKRNQEHFTSLEIKALILAALNHDVDHGGCTNSFLETINDDLTRLYKSSYWENHHYYVAMLILEKSKIFTTLTSEEYKIMLEEIKRAIIATDLHEYFKNRVKLETIANNFDWDSVQHKTLLKKIMMSASDLSAVCKPFLVAKRLIDNLYSEFYRQGDIEKDMGLCTLSIYDREKIHLIPEDQINFINIVALPCYKVLMDILPNSKPLYTEASFLLRTWQDIILIRGKKCWRQDDSIIEKKFSY